MRVWQQVANNLLRGLLQQTTCRFAADGSPTRWRDFRCAELEKEVATLKEKIHHLDDMLKSQQRKVRHMIEQVGARTHTHTHPLTHPLTPSLACHSCVCLFVLSKMQLQNSRIIMQERDRVIRDLEEKVAFLEAEVRNVQQRLNLTPNE